MLVEAIEKWPLDRLLPYAANARTHSESQVAQLAASMVEFGWTNPGLDDSKGNIIAGEMTWRHCYAIELNPAYADVGVLRWQEFTGKEATLESTGATFAQVAEDKTNANAIA